MAQNDKTQEKPVINNNDVKYKFNLEGVRRWIRDCCIENLRQLKDPNIKKLEEIYNTDYGTAARFAYTRILKNYIVLLPTSVITTAFKLSDPDIPGSEIIYGFLYTNPKNENISALTYTGTERLVHQLYCASASLLSRDGEYRQRINPVYVLMKIIEHENYKKIWNELEEHVVAKVNKYNWNTFTECFYPKDELKEYSEELETDITGRRFDVVFLVVCWFVEFINIVYNQKINHINKLFRVIMKFKDKKEVEQDIIFFNSLIEKYGKSNVSTLYNNLNCFTTAQAIGTESQIKVGQKIIPLNLSEVQNPFSIKYKPWREYLISEKIQFLVVNGICAGVPLLADYFYIKNARKTLFDNYVQYMKLEHSDQALGIARKLLEAQRSTFKPKSINVQPLTGKIEKADEGRSEKLINTYKEDDDQDTQSPDNYQEIEEWLSGKFRLLHEKIRDPIEYSREEIIMSEMALCIISEYVGRTFYDALNISISNERYRDDTGNMYDNFDIWSKYIFELIYTLYCLNSHAGVIHGDLHLNNFTLHPLYFSGLRDLSKIKNPHMMYVLDKQHFYSFPSKQYHIVIIDFSRSIVRPSMLDSFENFELVNVKKLKTELKDKITLIKPEERAEFLHEQIVRVIKFYETYFPDFTITKKSQLSLLLLNNFDALFPIIGGMDTFISLNNLVLFFKRNGFDKKYIANFKLIEDIVTMCEFELTDTLDKLLDDPKSINTTTIQYTNKKLLDQFFKNYAVITPTINNLDKFIKNNTLIDISIYENKEIYNLDNYSKFPEFTRTTKWYIDEKEIYESPIGKDIKVDRLTYEKEKIKALGYINYVATTYVNRIF